MIRYVGHGFREQEYQVSYTRRASHFIWTRPSDTWLGNNQLQTSDKNSFETVKLMQRYHLKR